VKTSLKLRTLSTVERRLLMERDCNTCANHKQESLAKVGSKCWDCTGTTSLIHWEPIQPVIDIQKQVGEDLNAAFAASCGADPAFLAGYRAEYAELHGTDSEPDVLAATDFLQEAQELIGQRGTERDKPQGERSMAQAVAIFNAMTGLELSESQGWKFMVALKFARMSGGKFKLDDYLDAIGYTALLTESVVNEN
jgi:hypothetical protein